MTMTWDDEILRQIKEEIIKSGYYTREEIRKMLGLCLDEKIKWEEYL